MRQYADNRSEVDVRVSRTQSRCIGGGDGGVLSGGAVVDTDVLVVDSGGGVEIEAYE